jgi:hypothetical protein
MFESLRCEVFMADSQSWIKDSNTKIQEDELGFITLDPTSAVEPKPEPEPNFPQSDPEPNFSNVKTRTGIKSFGSTTTGFCE